MILLKNLSQKKKTSKRVIQKTAEATSDLIGNKIADQIKSVSKMSPKELHSQNNDEKKNHKKDIYLQKKDNKLLMN